MKRRISFIITMIMIALLFTSCGVNSETEKIVPKYGLVGEAEYMYKNVDNFSDVVKDSKITVIEASSEEQEQLDNLTEDVVNFLNEEYNIEWKSEKIELYKVDFLQLEGYELYNAIAAPKDRKMYVNTTLNENAKFVEVHELIHCIRYENVGRCEFVMEKGDHALGGYTSEAFTDLITIKYFESKGISGAREFFNINSNYSYTTCALSMLERSIPNEIYYYLTEDMKSFKTDFTKLADKYIEKNEELEEEFEAFLTRPDMHMLVTRLILIEGIEEDLTKIWTDCVFGNFERVAIMSRDLDEKQKDEILQEVYDLFKSEGELPEELIEILDYLKSCMK